jgi:hypothetical protein
MIKQASQFRGLRPLWKSQDARNSIASMSKSGNPYAFVDRDMALDDALAASATGLVRPRIASAKPAPNQRELFAIAEAQVPLESIRSGNPYANVPFEDEERVRSGAPRVSMAERTQTSTKQEFREVSTLILSRYSPMFLRGRLRKHHREFIARNELKSPRARFAILGALRQFDLSSHSGLKTYLNREDDLLSEAQLKEVEESGDDAE